MTLTLPHDDPLGVLTTTRQVVERARSVAIDVTAIPEAVRRLHAAQPKPPSWRQPPHWWDDDERTARYVLVLDTLNFCFWGEPRWTVTTTEGTWNGYWALAAAIGDAIGRGVRILDPEWQRAVDAPRLRKALGGENEPPLLNERAANLRELGRVLLTAARGQALQFIGAANGDAVKLVSLVETSLPSFRDVATYDGREVRFLKRAQILAGDLFGAFEGQGPGALRRLDRLTAFADYKVPQVLRELGILRYVDDLADRIDSLVELPAGGPDEVEIRASTIWAVELLRRELAAQGHAMAAFEVDWRLWTAGQSLEAPRPYHRTRTGFY